MSNTPPPSPTLVASGTGTPIHTRSTTTSRYNTTFQNRSTTLNRLAREMAPYFLGPMPPDAFLDTFLPSQKASTFPGNIFESVIKAESERSMYDKLNESIQHYIPKLTIFKTANQRDKVPTKFPFSVAPDCSVYAQGVKDKPATDSSKAEFFIECKTSYDEDPFVGYSNLPPDKEHIVQSGDVLEKVISKSKAILNIGQMTAYVASQMGSQYRTHVFLIFIVKDYARLLRWDRSGAIFTAPMYYNQDSIFFDFFTRYNDADPNVRGHDETVHKPTDVEACNARSVLDLDSSTSLVTVTIPNRNDKKQEFNRYVICSPVADPHIPCGRSTRTSLAYDVQTSRRVFLKDFWRVDLPSILPEGDVYDRLKQFKVPNVPYCLQASDIGDVLYHGTQTHIYADAIWKPNIDLHFTPHRHYRLVLDHIGQKLETFSCSRDMVAAIHAALVAHEAAYQHGILHRDISVGNILIMKESPFDGGMLIDWDLCKVIDPTKLNKHHPRQYTRTGTWQFMAADLIRQSDILHTFIHDIESAFFVMLWLSIQYLPNIWSKQPASNASERSSFMQNILSPRTFHDTRGVAKLFFMQSESALDAVRFENEILQTLLHRMHMTLGVRHHSPPQTQTNDLDPLIIKAQLQADHVESSPTSKDNECPVDNEQLQIYQALLDCLNDHKVIIKMLKMALDSDKWPENDAAEAQPFVLSHLEYETMTTSSRRSRSQLEESDLFLPSSSHKRLKFAST